MTLHSALHGALSKQLLMVINEVPANSHWTPWHSVTFSGARHIFHFPTQVGTQKCLTNHEFAIPGHIIADVLVQNDVDGGTRVEILSVADA